jgi:hypothetical protein
VKPRERPCPAAPERLCRFVAAEWADRDDPFRAWCLARLDFVTAYPDGPLGDSLDVLAEHRRIKRAAAATDIGEDTP